MHSLPQQIKMLLAEVHSTEEWLLTTKQRELSGLILSYNKYGSHLNDQGVTIDTDLEMLEAPWLKFGKDSCFIDPA